MTLTAWVLSEIWQYSQWWLHFIGNFTIQWNYIVLLKSNWFELALKFLFALSKDEQKNPIRLSPFASFILSKKQKIEYCISQHVKMEFPGILGEFDRVILGIRSKIAFWECCYNALFHHIHMVDMSIPFSVSIPLYKQKKSRHKVLLLTFMRSGSTFVSEFFKGHPDSYYL